MKLLTGKRIGQSGGELAAAVSFSVFLHLVCFLGALFVSFHLSGRITVPLVYRVNLVDLPADVPLTAPVGPVAPAAPSPKAPEPKAKHLAPKAKQPAIHAVPKAAPVPKHAMPELGAEKPKPEKAVEAPSAPAAPATGAPGKKQEAVAVSVPSGGGAFPFPPYVAILRDKVERNWNPPPGAKGLKARVTFRVLRSGRVGDSRLEEASGNFYFDQAAMRAILASSPFPPLPEGFFKDDEVFSVDLMEMD